jgi:antitoxin HicB
MVRTAYSYPAILEPGEDGRLVVRFPDLPEALTDGADKAEALSEAVDCLSEALASRIVDGEEIPPPTPLTSDQHLVSPDPTIALKAALYTQLRQRDMTIADLADRLGLADWHQAARLMDPRRSSKLTSLAAALEALGCRIAISVESSAELVPAGDERQLLSVCRSTRDETKFRKQLPRVYELRDMAQSPPSAEAYFSDFDNKLGESSVRLKHFQDIEAELQGLDASAWSYLKAQLAPLLTLRNEKRGWQALFDKLNEAKGYNHLVSVGYTSVEFVPTSSVNGQRTPDLQGRLAGVRVLCEVKTINISEVEATRRANDDAGSISRHLTGGFFSKLASDIETAKSQMAAYDADNSTKKIVYIVVNFDDSLHEYADDLSAQIDSFIAANPMSQIDVVFHIKPPFYSATA